MRGPAARAVRLRPHLWDGVSHRRGLLRSQRCGEGCGARGPTWPLCLFAPLVRRHGAGGLCGCLARGRRYGAHYGDLTAKRQSPAAFERGMRLSGKSDNKEPARSRFGRVRGICLVPEVRVELTRPKPEVFETSVSAIPPLGHVTLGENVTASAGHFPARLRAIKVRPRVSGRLPPLRLPAGGRRTVSMSHAAPGPCAMRFEGFAVPFAPFSKKFEFVVDATGWSGYSNRALCAWPDSSVGRAGD